MRRAAGGEVLPGFIEAELAINGEAYFGCVSIFLAVVFPPANRAQGKNAGSLKGFVSTARATKLSRDSVRHEHSKLPVYGWTISGKGGLHAGDGWSSEAEDDAGADAGVAGAGWRFGWGAEVVCREPPGKEGSNADIAAASEVDCHSVAGDGSGAAAVGGVLPADEAMHKEMNCGNADCHAWSEEDGGGAWNGGSRAEAVVGNVAFNADEGHQLNVPGELPAIEPSDVGVEGVAADVAVAEVDIADRAQRMGRRREYE